MHVFVCALGYSGHPFAFGYPNEKLSSVLDGHERSFRHFGGVALTCLYDNPRTMVLGRSEGKVLWLPIFEDFARYYGFTPAVPGADEGEGRERREVREAQRDRGGLEDPRDDARAPDRPLAVERMKLIPLGNRPPYRFERVMIRKVPSDALVSIAASRYSVPVRYVGEAVSVHETAGGYEIFHHGDLVARHAKSPRHSVVMEPEHYQGLLRPGRGTSISPPKWDPGIWRSAK